MKDEGGTKDEQTSHFNAPSFGAGLPTPPETLNSQPSTLNSFYQLTHDYLVPSLRDWLTRKQKETRRGRAELRLAERASLWTAKPENRRLPAWWEWLNIRLLTQQRKWTEPQAHMMRRATRVHGIRFGFLAVILAALTFTALQINRRMVDASHEQQAAGLVTALLNADIQQVPGIITELNRVRRWAQPMLEQEYGQSGDESRERLHISLALLPTDGRQVDYLKQRLLTADPGQVDVIRRLLAGHKELVLEDLWQVVEESSKTQPRQLLPAAGALALYDGDSQRWPAVADRVTSALVNENALRIAVWIDILQPARRHLLGPLGNVLRNRDAAHTQTERDLATNILEKYAADDVGTLAELILDAEPKAFVALFDELEKHRDQATQILKKELDRRLEGRWPDAPLDPQWKSPAPELVQKIEAAQGLISERFAFCQTMPLDEFVDVAESLRACGYRPIRFRPYAVGQLFEAVPSEGDRSSRAVPVGSGNSLLTHSLKRVFPTAALPGGGHDSALQSSPPTAALPGGGHDSALQSSPPTAALPGGGHDSALTGKSPGGYVPTEFISVGRMIDTSKRNHALHRAKLGGGGVGAAFGVVQNRWLHRAELGGGGDDSSVGVVQNHLLHRDKPRWGRTTLLVSQKSADPAYSVHVAAIWTRDGRPWQIVHGLTADEIRHRDAQLRTDGFAAVDVAGYGGEQNGDPAEHYVGVWGKRTEDDPETRMYIAASEDQHRTVFDRLVSDGSWQRQSLQAYQALDGQRKYSGVYRKSAQAGTFYWTMTPVAYEDVELLDMVQVDVDVSRSPEIVSQREQYRRELADLDRRVVAESQWTDPTAPPDDEAVTSAIQQQLTESHGMLHDRFAICQTMPLDEFKEISQRLTPLGYRPIRLRPFSLEKNVHVAAIWNRDNRRWEMVNGKSAQEVRQTDAELQQQGYLPVDVAGYITNAVAGTPAVAYAALWAKKDPGKQEEARLYVGVSSAENSTMQDSLRAAGFSRITLHYQIGTTGERHYSGVFAKWPEIPTYYASWNNGERNWEQKLQERASQYAPVDVSVSTDGRYSMAWHRVDNFEARTVRPQAPDDHLRESQALAAKGFRPAAISVVSSIGAHGLAAVSVWHRPFPTSLMRRAMANFYLGHDQQAIEDFSVLIGKAPQSSQLYQFRSILHARMQKAEEAKVDLQQFQELNQSASTQAYVQSVVAAYLGEDSAAVERLEAMIEEDRSTADLLYDAACAYSIVSSIVLDKEAAKSKVYAERAVSLLEQAVANGYTDYSHIQTDADLDPLRQDDRFQQILQRGQLDFRYAAVWQVSQQYEAHELHGLAPEEHLAQCQRLITEGYRPAAMSAVSITSPALPSISQTSVTPKAWSYGSPGWSDDRVNGRRVTLGSQTIKNREPQRGGPRIHPATFTTNRVTNGGPLGPPLWGFDSNGTRKPGLRDVRRPHVAPPWADLEPPLSGLSQRRRGLAYFAQSSEQNVPVPLSATSPSLTRRVTMSTHSGLITASVWHRPLVPDVDKEQLAKRQANAAVALVRLGHQDDVWPLLKHSPDPRQRTWIIHRLSALGADPEVLVRRLEEEPDVSIRRALIMSLGEYVESNLSGRGLPTTPPDPTAGLPDVAEDAGEVDSVALGGETYGRDRAGSGDPHTTHTPAPTATGLRDAERVAELLSALYRDDPDPGIHGASEWVLRRLGKEDELANIDEQLIARHRSRSRKTSDETTEDPSLATSATDTDTGQRDWYVNTQGQTMVVLDGPVEFLMGSPGTEAYRFTNERLHRRRIGRSFAIASKEVTVAQFQRFLQETPMIRHGYTKRCSPEEDTPQTAVTWYEAAAYCRWLSEKEGLPEDQMCYPPIVEIKEGMKLPGDYLSRTGYRLPTEAEWEYACRAGAATARYYGSTDELLGQYAWYIHTASDRSWPVATLKPNDFGLFDMQGNVWEWCQEAYVTQTVNDSWFVNRLTP